MCLVADLHMHSCASDGALSVARMLACARIAGLSAVSVTDHDTFAGTAEACQHAPEYGLSAIPGVEISTQTDGRDVHMLGYFVDVSDSGLADLFEENRHRREMRACAIADNLASDGFSVSADSMRATGRTLNRSTLARMLIASGYAADMDDAFERLIGEGSPYYVESSYTDTSVAIERIIAAGGFAFIAHPAQYGVVDLIAGFAAQGMSGLEAFHTLQSPEDTSALVGMAASLGLGVSGGSDWHGDDTHGARIAGAGLTAGQFESFLSVCAHTGR